MKVSLYSDVMQVTELPKLVEVTEILYDILGGKWKTPIEELRSFISFFAKQYFQI